MVKGMGGAKFDELLNWLMETLKCEQSSVDRSGAAQGKLVVDVLLQSTPDAVYLHNQLVTWTGLLKTLVKLNQWLNPLSTG
jgi:hypothetical protein